MGGLRRGGEAWTGLVGAEGYASEDCPTTGLSIVKSKACVSILFMGCPGSWSIFSHFVNEVVLAHLLGRTTEAKSSCRTRGHLCTPIQVLE
jgi:hypothetical protein